MSFIEKKRYSAILKKRKEKTEADIDIDKEKVKDKDKERMIDNEQGSDL